MNISQEAITLLETLVEEKLVNGLKLTTTEYRPVTAYQVSEKGMQFLNSLPNSLFQEINSFVYAPHAPMVDTELLHVSFIQDSFIIKTQSGYSRESSVTDIEDVSYVVSPHIPSCLLTPLAKHFRNNAHRAHEASVGMSNIRDKKFREAVRLSGVKVVVGEWVPLGANGIVQLNDKLNARNRCQGGLFSALIDKTPMDMCFRMAPGLTSVKVIDYKYVRHSNLEVEVVMPEESGIVQIEVLGLHINMDGTIYQGCSMEAIMNRSKDDVSLDFLARVLVDIQLDSNKVLHDLLTGYHRSLLDVMYMKDALNRAKYNIVITEKIHPFKKAMEYADRGWFENEIKQVLGSLQTAEDLSSEDVLILGRDGLLLAGPSSDQLEPYIFHYASLKCREEFVSNLFLRTFVLKEGIEKIHQIIQQHHTDPSNLNRIQSALSEASSNIFQIYEILDYLESSLDDSIKPPPPQDSMCKKLVSILSTESLTSNIMNRVEDMRKLIQGKLLL
mmetsp:Transcript_16806/g.45849  ORF Transcript_16806/g.45849 Transcript_16806/m.45849 type:complete len:500 (+) Transcript_16806:468-1967(+)